jgi:hypothetical protein
MKISLPKNLKIKLSQAAVISLILAFVIICELYLGYTSLYTKLKPETGEVVLNKIVKVDLKAYQETSDLILRLQNFVPEPLFLENQNPFNYK